MKFKIDSLNLNYGSFQALKDISMPPIPTIPKRILLIWIPPYRYIVAVFLIYSLAFSAYSKGFAFAGSCSASTMNQPS